MRKSKYSYNIKSKYKHKHKNYKVLTKIRNKGVVFKISVLLFHVHIALSFKKKETQSRREDSRFQIEK